MLILLKKLNEMMNILLEISLTFDVNICVKIFIIFCYKTQKLKFFNKTIHKT